jgi:hypothetical protein
VRLDRAAGIFAKEIIVSGPMMDLENGPGGFIGQTARHARTFNRHQYRGKKEA